MSSDIAIPKWLNEQLIEKAVKEAEGNEIKLKQMQVRAATSPGDHYSSLMYRIVAEYDVDNDRNCVGSTKSFVLKTMVEHDGFKELMAKSSVFSTELEVLGKIIPEFHRVLNTSPTAVPVFLGPRCYLTSDTSREMILMEDICELGFAMASRNPGLDLDHCRLVVSRLGMFHAASVATRSQKPELYDNFLTPMRVKAGEAGKNFVTISFSSVVDKVKLWPGGQKYSDKLHDLSRTAFQRLLYTEQRDDHGFNVFNHGDVWTNNMMFRYNENGEVSDMIFLDFQCSYYGSPALDLLYFLYTSPTPEVRSRHMEELVECYHSSLSKTLARLGCGRQCPSLDEFHVEMKKRNFMAAYAFFCVRPIVTANPNNIPDMSKLLDDPAKTKFCTFQTGEYEKEIQALLPMLEKEGLFE